MRKRERWPRGRGRRARAVVNVCLHPINRGAWFHSNPSLGKPFLSHLPPLHYHYNTIIHHHHPPPSSIFHHLECVVVSGSKIDRKSLCVSPVNQIFQ
ncbi:hypothetical protein HanRHA438_Chr10g0435851 [Helianthus annuus]|nr:hypothetical protein HanRHA438_Chr10g0435851 [Helianthus annuus]